MFNNKTRARVPSAGTLQVLCQLAYISSGTAVGIAALCAEERRRRTLILQKIADNARRLRQSPRHVHNAALARSEESADWIHEDLGPPMKDGLGDIGSKGHITNQAAVREPELPSVVEKGYGQVAAMNAHPARDLEFPPDESAHDSLLRPSNHNHTGPQPVLQPLGSHSTVYREYRRSTGRRLRRIEAPGHPPKVPLSTSQSQPEFLTLKTSDDNTSDLANKVESDIHLFLQSQPWSRRGLMQEVRVADHLLAKALECASVTEARSIYEWKLRHTGLSHQDLRQICDSCSHLAAHQDREVVLDFYIEFVATESFYDAPERLRYQLTFKLVAEIMRWGLPITNLEIINALLGSRKRSDSDALHDALDPAIRDLLADGHVDAAADLIVNTSKCDHRLAIPLADLVFRAARDEGRLVICHKILNWKLAAFQRQETSVDQYEWFIRMCDEQKTYHMLNQVLHSLKRPGWFKWLVPKLNSRAKLVLATACTGREGFHRDIFRKLYDEMPKDTNQSLKEMHSVLQLETLWNTTRDLNAVRSLFDELRNHSARDKESLGISIKMVEILSSAHRPDQALELLQALSSSRVERAQLTCLAAEVMAKKKAWKGVDRLLNTIAKVDGSASHIATSRSLGRIAHLFCQQHGSQESWRYIKSLMRRFDYQPTRGTVQSLLQCFVTHKSLDMIPRCLGHLRWCGVDIHMDTELAATLLSIYAWLQRPTHILMMELCRNLVAIAPWLDSTKLIRVIEEAIASDLRNATRKNRDELQIWSKRSLAALQQLNSPSLPLPSWSHDVKSLTKKFTGFAETEVVSSPNKEWLSRTVTDQVKWERPIGPLEGDDPAQETLEGSDFFESGDNRLRRKRAEQEMILAFSCDDHEKVLELYRRSLDPIGLPLSPVALEVATESALRRSKGGESDALAMLQDAQVAGMNISCAMGPVLIHRMRGLTAASQQDANRLRTAVIDYYRMNQENGWKVRHYVGVSAADVLTRHNRASLAINLLNAIYYSDWATDRPLDIVAMTVYVKSYAALKSIQGVSWVVQKVLQTNMRIDRKFKDALKDSLRHFGHERGGDSRPETAQCVYIRQLRAKCIRVEREQARQTKAFGIELVQCIAKCGLPDEGRARDIVAKVHRSTASPV